MVSNECNSPLVTSWLWLHCGVYGNMDTAAMGEAVGEEECESYAVEQKQDAAIA